MTTPTMTINGVEYVEATTQQTGPDWDNVCSQCALGQPGMLAVCRVAILGNAKSAFGGDCQARDVIYLRKDSPAAP